MRLDMAASISGVCCDLTGLPVTCSNSEAVQSYNEGLRVFFKVRAKCVPALERACELDNSLVLAHCLLASFWMCELKTPNSPEVAPHVAAAKSADSVALNERERRHVEAMLSYASGNLPQALEQWVAIIVDYPLDSMAIRLAFYSCIMLGEFECMRDFFTIAVPHWTESMEFYPYFAGLFAFSLEETNSRERAEEVARKALAAEPRVCWATHALAHVIEEERDVSEGVELLTSTRSDWADSALGGHISWHLTLFYFDLGDVDAVLKEFDDMLYDRASADDLYGIVDAASLLWRLNVQGVDVGEHRWEKVTSACAAHVDTHGLAWYNVHIMMGLAHGKVTESTARLALAEHMLKSLEDYSRSNISADCKITEMIGIPACNAFLAFGKGQYEEVISLLLPLRYDLVRLGGSWAQRQVFHSTLLHAAMKCNKLPLALALVAELKATKPRNHRLAILFEQLKASFDGLQNEGSSLSLPDTIYSEGKCVKT